MTAQLDEPCQRCGQRPAVRLIGTVAHCAECAEAFLAPIRAGVIAKHGSVDVIRRRPATATGPRPDHGAGMWDMRCEACGAGWVGPYGDECSWCEEREERQRRDERESLLRPAWLDTSDGDGRYDALSDVDKAVWNRTRGIATNSGAVNGWLERLARAVACGLVTEPEALGAIAQFGRRNGRRDG